VRGVSLRVVAFVGVAAAFASCTVNFEGKRFCKPDCTAPGGGDTVGFTETFNSTGPTGGGGSGGSTSQGGGGGCGGKAAAPINDDFTQKNMPPAAFWTLLFPKRSAPAMVEDNDALLITPTPQATWYTGAGACPADGCGAPAVVQRISGNFTMKTHVAITFTANGHADPFAAAGILLAEPCDAAKNNVVWDIGYQDQGSMGTDFYETVDGAPSMPQTAATTVVEADLYACRLDDQFYFYVDTIGVAPMPDSPDATIAWTVGDLDVGLTAHVNGQKQVIEAQFHSVSFAPVETQADCIDAL
jgi:hypothetical protein